MSLAGIAISIGVLVDGAIVEVENAYNKLHLWEAGGRKGDFHAVRLEALKEVGPSVFFSLLVIAVAFLPIFALVDQEGRLFKPLAYSKNLAMALAALLAITLDPAMRMMFTRMDPLHVPARASLAQRSPATPCVGTYHAEEKHPISRGIFQRLRAGLPLGPAAPPDGHRSARRAIVAVSIPAYFRLGSEFMPPLERGHDPLHADDPARHLGGRGPGAAADAGPDPQVVPRGGAGVRQGGRAETSTDPAPFSMMETTVILKPPRRVAAASAAGTPPGRRAGSSRCSRPIWPDRISLGRAGRGDGRGAARSRA